MLIAEALAKVSGGHIRPTSFVIGMKGQREGLVAVLDPDLVVRVDAAGATSGQPVEVHGARTWATGAGALDWRKDGYFRSGVELRIWFARRSGSWLPSWHANSQNSSSAMRRCATRSVQGRVNTVGSVMVAS